MKKLLTQDNFLLAAVFLIGLANFFLPMAINLNGMMLTAAVIFILLQIRSVAVFRNFLNAYFLLTVLLFGLYCLSLLYSDNLEFGKDSLGRKSLILLFPVAFFLLTRIAVQHFKLIVWMFTLSNILVLLISVTEASMRAFQQHDLSQLTHNNLCLVFDLQATYLALYLVTNCILLVSLYHQKLFTNGRLLVVLLLIFTTGVLLSGARSMYVALFLFGLFYLVHTGMREKKLHRKHLFWGFGILAALCIIIYTVRPLRERILEATRTDLSLLELKRFEHDTPFNGITMRLLFWKLGYEILTEKNAFLTGVGLGDAQDLLEQKFYQYNVYTGNPDYGDTGYLHYNYHGQFVQLTMHIGLLGLTVLLLLFGTTLWQTATHNDWLLASVVIVFLLVFVSESALERQFGVSHIFFWLPLLYRIRLKNPQ